jgi:hypothetical protein
MIDPVLRIPRVIGVVLALAGAACSQDATAPAGAGRDRREGGGAGEEPALVRAAREQLGEGVVESRCGPYHLLTDVDDRKLLAVCLRVGEGVGPAFRKRFAVEVEGAEGGHILFLDRRTTFDAVAARAAPWGRKKGSFGDPRQRVVVVHAGGRPETDLARLLAWELALLVHDQAFSGEVPPWLRQGLAGSVGTSATVRGFLPLGDRSSIGPELQRVKQVLITTGAMPLGALFDRSAADFDGEEAQRLRDQSVLLVRYLLTEPRLAPRFRGILARLAAGEALPPGGLERGLGVSPAALDAAFAGWARAV